MEELVSYADVVVANEEDADKVLGISAPDTDVETGKLNEKGYISVAKQICAEYGVKQVAITLRKSLSASDNLWSAMLYDGQNAYFSREYKIHIVNRVGGGDSFTAGLIYALANQYQPQKAIDFAAAASCLTVCDSMARQASLSMTNSQSLLKLMPTESVMSSHHLILCHPLLLLLSIFPTIRVFSKESVLHIRWPNCCSFSFSISPSSEHSGLISFRMDWLALLAVQGTLKSLLQHHSSKASVLWCSAFFMVQLTSIHDYWKNHSFD